MGWVVRNALAAAGLLLLFVSIPSFGGTAEPLSPATAGRAASNPDDTKDAKSPGPAPVHTAMPPPAAVPSAAAAGGSRRSRTQSFPGSSPVRSRAESPRPGGRPVTAPRRPHGIFRRASFGKDPRPGTLPRRGGSAGDEKHRGGSGRGRGAGRSVLRHRLDRGREREGGGLLRDHPADRQVHPLLPDRGEEEVRAVPVPLGEVCRDDAADPLPVRPPRGPRLRRADRKRVLHQGVLRGEGGRALAVHLCHRPQVRPPHRLVGRRASGRREVDARRRFLPAGSLRDVRVVAARHRRVQRRRGEDPEGGHPVQVRRFLRAHPSRLPEAGDEGLRPQDAGRADHRQGSGKIRIRRRRLRGAAGPALRVGAGRDRPGGGGPSSRCSGGVDPRLEPGASAVLHPAEPGAVRPPALRRRGAPRRGADGGDPYPGEGHLPPAQRPQEGNASGACRPVQHHGPGPEGVERAEAGLPRTHRAPRDPRDRVDGDGGGPRYRGFAGPTHDGAYAGGGREPKGADPGREAP